MPACVLLACLLALFAGCGKQQVSSPPTAEPTADNTARPAESLPTAALTNSLAEASDDAQMAAVLGELTQVVRKYGVERRSVPKNLEELVANGYLTRAPQAPSGKKFAITKDLRVQLVNK